MIERSVERLRKKAYANLREFEATVSVVCPPDLDARRRLAQQREIIRTGNKRQLHSINRHLEERIKATRRDYKIQAPASLFLRILDWLDNAPAGRFVVLPLYFLRSLFKKGNFPIPRMDLWPAHARVALDSSGILYDQSRHPEVYLLEATMFEDMASLFNMAKRDDATISESTTDKALIKRRNALSRATVATAVYFVEAYLNGLAVNFFLTTERRLDDETKSTLFDWDFKKDRPRYISLREKILQYQRIVLGVEHAPLQEGNCPDVATILKTAKLTRDAVAHPSPAFDLETFDAEKERAIIELKFSLVEKAVDAAVSLVGKLEERVQGNRKRIFWLYPRGADGYFPVQAFD